MRRSTVATFKYLTEDEARTLTRHELLDRVEAQQVYYDVMWRKTPADEAAMNELSRIIHRYLNINAAFDAAFATLGGYKGTRYWETRPEEDRPAGPPAGSGWPSSSASPQEQTAAVLARLTPERLTAEADEQP
jgi:hypothetical protein